MKPTFIFLFVWLFISLKVNAQACKNPIKYREKMLAADSCIAAGNFSLAYENYKAGIYWCKDSSATIERAKEVLFRQINVARENALLAQREAENARNRASAQLLTLKARSEIGKSPPLVLRLSIAAIEATEGQGYAEPSSEQTLRDELSQIRGRPLGVPIGDEIPFLYDISPNRRWVLTSGHSQNFMLWKFDASGKLVKNISLDSLESPARVRFDPNSKLLVFGRSSFAAKEDIITVPLETADRPETYEHIEIPDGSVSIDKISFSPDGRLVLVSMDYPEEKPARLYRISEDGLSLSEISLQSTNGKQYGSSPEWKFSPDSDWLVSYLRNYSTLLWDLRQDGLAVRYTLSSKSKIGDRWADFSGDMKWLATYGYSDTPMLWSLEGKTPTRKFYPLATGTGKNVERLKFSADGKWVLANTCLWKLKAGKLSGEPFRLTTSNDPRYWFHIDFTGDGRRLILIERYDSQEVTIWELNSGKPVQSDINIKGQQELSPDKHWMIKMQPDQPARLWNLQDGPMSLSGSIALPGLPVTQAQFAHDNSILATAHADGSIRLHTLQGLDEVQTAVLRESGVAANGFQFSPNDSWLLATSSSTPYLFKLLKNATPLSFRLEARDIDLVTGHGKETSDAIASSTDFEFSPEEHWLIAKQSSKAYIWDLHTEQISRSVQFLKGHEYGIRYFGFVAGENALITTEFYGSFGGAYRKRPRLWDLSGLTSGIYPLVARHPDPRVTWAEFSPNGELLATIGSEGTLVISRIKNDETLELVLIREEMGFKAENERAVKYPGWQSLPQFDETGRWFITASKAGQLYTIDCAEVVPKVHEIAQALGSKPFVAINGEKSLLALSVEGKPNQMEVWDLDGQIPQLKAELDLEWARKLNGYDPPEIEVVFMSKEEIAVVAPAESGGGREVWRYLLAQGEGIQSAVIRTEGNLNIADGGYLMAGSEGVFNLHTQKTLALDGRIPHPKTYRKVHSNTKTSFKYLLSPSGRWLIGRRYILEGYPEFGRERHYSWRWVFDLHSQTPQQAVVELPEVQESIFANFADDSNHWVSVSESGMVTIVTLPAEGAPQVTTKNIDQYFSGRYSGSPLWSTGSVSYDVSFSPEGDWLVTRRGDLMYLLELKEPYEGKLLRGFEARRSSSNLNLFFGANDDLVFIGNQFWRTRLNDELLWPVNLGGNILAASANGKWVATSSNRGFSLHTMEIAQLVKKAWYMAGRDLTSDEKEQFLIQTKATR